MPFGEDFWSARRGGGTAQAEPEPYKGSEQAQASGIDFRSPQGALDAGGFAPGAGSPTEQARILSGAGGPEDAMNRSVQALTEEGIRLRDEEQQGLDYAKDLFNEFLPEMTRHPLTERDMNELAAGRLEEIARGRMADMASLKEYTGQTNLEGGITADLAAQVSMGAMGQATSARRELRSRAADMTAQHQMKLLSIAGASKDIQSAVSTYAAEAAAMAAGLYQRESAADKGYQAAKDANKTEWWEVALGIGKMAVPFL